jgi:hypothetical protein
VGRAIAGAARARERGGGLILTVELLAPPIIGLADNGDHEKVLGPVGFQYRQTSFNAKSLILVGDAAWIVQSVSSSKPAS